MKEASGEANMTIITIVLIGVIVAVVTPLITGMMDDTKKKANCTSQGKCWINNACAVCPNNQ